MKLYYLQFIVFFLIIQCNTFAQTAVAPLGDGSTNNPYRIASLENLYWISQNSDRLDKNYIQTANIDLSAYSNWSPIGDAESPFKGNYNGDGFVISHPTITDDQSYSGLFGYTDSAFVYGVTLDSVSITKSSNYAGSLVAYATNSTFKQCSVSGTIIDTRNKYDYMGGLLGYGVNITIVDCHSSVTIYGDLFLGGLIGYLHDGQIIKSSATGTIHSNTTSRCLGGFIGLGDSCTISRCFATGDITDDELSYTASAKFIGGFAGHLSYCNISNCYSTGSGKTGSINNNTYQGGFCGYAGHDTITNCYSAGNITGKRSQGTVYGFIGSLDSYSTSENCFYDRTTCDFFSDGAADSKTTDEMQTPVTFREGGWDFSDETYNGTNDYWGHNINKNNGYPFLAWQGYENIFLASPIYVDQTAEGSADGTSWPNAFTSLTTALERTGPGDTIWVAEGSYSPDNNENNFVPFSGIILQGGFKGTETNSSQRNWNEHQTILTGGTQSVLYLYNISSFNIDGFTISSGVNTTYNGGGGGIYNYRGTGTFLIKNCTFKNNEGYSGGAVFQYGLTDSKLIIENCKFIENESNYSSTLGNNYYIYAGGAVANKRGKLIVRNCLFTGNHSNYGCAIFNYSSAASTEIINCTFYNNSGVRGTILGNDHGDISIVNSIIFDNSLALGRDIYRYSSNVKISVSYSNIEGSGGSDNWDSDYGTDDGNNIDKDPFWTDADNGDLNPTKYSWCVDTGTPDTTGLNLPETDLKGNPRIYQGDSLCVDMGAYECQNDRNYAPYPPANNVTFSESTDSTMRISWSPGEGDQFLVFLSADTTGFASPENNKSYLPNTQFQLGDQIENSGWYAVYDGPDTTFTVTGLDTVVNYKAHVIAHYTGKLVYNCDSASGNPAISTRCVTNNNNSGAGSLNQAIEEARSGAKTICFNLPEGKDTIVLSEQIELRKAFTFEGRNRSGSGTNITITVPEPGVSTWRAFYVRTTCTIKNMTITGGSVNNGGAMYIYSGKTTLKNVTVSNSKSTQNGGGVYAKSDLILENCKVVGNTASSQGGGIYSRDYLYIINSSVSNNSSSYGAGIYNSSNLYIYNTTISKNDASNYGGGIYNNSTITNSSNNTIVENTANLGGGIYNRYRIRNLSFNTISGNKAVSGSGIYQDNSNSELTIQNTILAKNYSETGILDDYYGKYGELTDKGYNIIGRQDYYSSSSSPKFTLSSNENIYQQGTMWKKGTEELNNQKLGLDSVLTDNGGATLTLALSDSSFAAGAGITDANVAYDQRGVLRTEPPTIGAFGIEGSLPDAVTKPATDITAKNITLNGTVNPNGYATSITFEYGKTESYGNTIIASQSPLSGFGETEIAEIISGLDANETYYYRIVAVNTIGKIYGKDVNFKTAAPEISFFGNSTEITNGDNTTNTLNGTNFESVLVNTPKTFSFLIKNSGTGPLQLTGTSLIKINGSDSLCFSVSKYPAKSIVANDTSTFEITFTPDTIRSFSASLKIENNVPENNPFIFSVSGSGIDTTPPVFTETPPSNTLQSCDAVTDAVTLTATDNFDTEVDIDFSEVYSDSLCDNSYTITRKWTATDNCGNQASHTQVVTVQDTISPVFVESLPADTTQNCDAVVAAATLTATDNCDADVDVSFKEIYSDTICDNSYTITRKWTATDNCGNQASHTQVITVQDTISPVFVESLPADTTQNCDAVVAAATLTATDNCDADVDVSFKEIYSDTICDNSYTITRIWIAEDNCGNQTSYTQVITVQDTISPVFVESLPADTTLNCDAVVAAATLTATDNCDADVDVSFEEVYSDSICDNSYTITRTWIAEDNCGNQASHTQVITVQDTISPVFVESLPADTTQNCDAVTAAATLTATDNCDADMDVSFEEVYSDTICDNSYRITRIWTATDNCGNQTSHTQVITVQDTISPVFVESLPADTTQNCDAVTVAATLTATDNCDADVDVSFEEIYSDTICDNSYTITRTWIAEDNCGNQTSYTQVITVQDTISPVFVESLPADTIQNCDAVTVAATLTATDNCDADVNVSFEEVYSDTICDNSYIITRIWTATDNCGNYTFHSQVVRVQDTTPPTFTTPDNVTIYSDSNCEYDSSVAQTGDVTNEKDNCSTTELEATFTDKTEAGEYPGEWIITRTWSLSDYCGNKAKEQIQIITVKDSIPPKIIWTPIKIFLNENGEYKLTDEDIAALTEKITDNCTPSENIEIELSPKSFNCSNTEEKTEMQIVAVDINGNSSKVRETITVSDTISPTINKVEDISIVLKNNPCDTFVSINYPEISFRDNCGATLKQITGLGSQEAFPVGSTTETWVVTDKSRNTDTLSFNVSIIPGNASPTIDPIADMQINEDQEPVFLNLSGISSGNDCLTQELSISVTSSNNTLTDSLLIDYTQGAPTAILKIVPASNMNGETKITVTIEDSEGGTISKTFTVTIEAVNDAPYIITSIPDQIIHASSILKIPVSPFTGHLFGDIEDEILTINITSEGNNSLPTWATLTGDTIVCTPAIADTGCVNIIAKATDAEGAFVTDTFQVCVNGFPVGINSAENEEFEIIMYPNPTSGEVTIKFSSKTSNAELIITDMAGKTVFTGQVNTEQKIMLDLSDNVSGIYFVRLIMDKKQIVKQLILKTRKHIR